MGKGKYKGRRAEAFIFDLDGTLVDSGRDIALSANFTRAHFNLPELELSQIESYVGDGVANLLSRALGHNIYTGLTGIQGLPVSEELHQEGMAVFADHYSRHLLDHTRLYPGVLEILARYRGFPLHVATNKPQKFTEAILSGLHLDGAFRKVLGGDVVTARKPDSGHLQECLEGISVDITKVVMVGDSPNDINAAKELGAISVGCSYGLVPLGAIKATQPDFLIADISELAGLFPSRS